MFQSARRFAVMALLFTSLTLVARAADLSPQALIRDVVYNELNDHQHHGYWQYLVEKKTAQQTTLQEEVETTGGHVDRLIALNGEPLNAGQQQAEDQRLAALAQDAGEQARLRSQYEEDERRIGSIMQLLPNAFLYTYDGREGDVICLRFTPNPAFEPPTYQGKVFHAMAGTVWVNSREKRLARLQGQIVDNVDFGFGLLGRVNKGGTFEMVRREISPGNWKTSLLDVHITGHVILLKCMGKEERDVRSDFRPVPRGLNIAEAEALLDGSRNASRRAHLDPVEKLTR